MKTESKRIGVPRTGACPRLGYAAALCATVLTLSTLPAPAMAAGNLGESDARRAAESVFDSINRSSDPESAYKALTGTAREAFDRYYQPAGEVTTVTLVALDADGESADVARSNARTFDSFASAEAAIQRAGAGCYAGNGRTTVVNGFGVGLFDTWVEGKWCGNGVSTSSATFLRSWATVGVVGWRDAGQKDKGAGVNRGVGRIFAQRHFVFGAGGVDITHNYPCARIVAIDSGSHIDTGCSIY